MVRIRFPPAASQRRTCNQDPDAWVAKRSEPAVFAFVLIDAEPVEKGGNKLTTHYPTP